ncbi:hypothetical protein [Methylomicrobium lacus]|uniref:hypothetical protein n=1 Tax=Methylomicrobium lacus TaxID=136992 RepID=UPI0004B17ABD|nr:hypothetical protein [Methylomicrobium lacus]
MANDEMLEFVENEKNKRRQYSLMFDELKAREDELRKQIAYQQSVIAEQEVLLEKSRKKIKEEQLSRENAFQQELEERERLFEKREESIFQRQKQMEENFHVRMLETESLRKKLESEIANRENALKVAFEELEQEKSKYREESRRQIESKSKDYVSTALSGLETKENNFHFMSKLWSFVGASAIILGIIFITYATFNGSSEFHNSSGFTWTYFLYVTFRGLVVIAMFVALARYAFLFSNSYMHESLKSGERRHAINFGKFYLEAYGADANWSQVKEAFQHWNISNESAFTNKQTSEFDPKILENALEICKVMKSSQQETDKSSNEKA